MAVTVDPQTVAEATALIEATAQARQNLTATTTAAVTAQVRAFNGWYDHAAITRLAKNLAALTGSGQRQTATLTSSYMTRLQRLLQGRTGRVAPRVPVADLRGVPLDSVFGRLADEYRYLHATRTATVPVVDGVHPAGKLLTDDDIDRMIEQRAATMVDQSTSLAMVTRWAQATDHATGTVTGYRRVIHPELPTEASLRDGREPPPVCGLCVAASTRTYSRGSLMPMHANCIPGYVRVSARGTQGLTRRHYAGPLIILSTASGNELAVTPNHPVLTGRGWVPAQFVHDGDSLIRALGGQWTVRGGPQEHDRPPSVEEAWRAAAVGLGSRARRMPLAAEDFYGDGRDGEVDVVSTDGLLADILHAEMVEALREELFVARHLGRVGLSIAGAMVQPLGAMPHATDSIVRGGGYALALLGGAVAEAQKIGFAAPPDLYASFLQSEPYGDATGAVLLRESEFGRSLQILLDDLGVGQGEPGGPRFDPAGLKFTGEGASGYADLGARLLGRLAGQVELDRVLESRRVDFSDHVYDLQTVEGWFEADGYVVSNCRCLPVPILGEIGGPGDIGALVNTDDLARLYSDAGGSTSAAALKATKYHVVDHAELGPQLVAHTVRAKPYVQKARTAAQRAAARESAARSRQAARGRAGA